MLLELFSQHNMNLQGHLTPCKLSIFFRVLRFPFGFIASFLRSLYRYRWREESSEDRLLARGEEHRIIKQEPVWATWRHRHGGSYGGSGTRWHNSFLRGILRTMGGHQAKDTILCSFFSFLLSSFVRASKKERKKKDCGRFTQGASSVYKRWIEKREKTFSPRFWTPHWVMVRDLCRRLQELRKKKTSDRRETGKIVIDISSSSRKINSRFS